MRLLLSLLFLAIPLASSFCGSSAEDGIGSVFLMPSPGVLSHTLSTPSRAGLFDDPIILMPTRAVYLSGISCSDSISAQHVLLLSAYAQVVRIHTSSVFAQVVDDHSIWNGPTKKFPRSTVGKNADGTARFCWVGNVDDSIPHIVQASGPVPAYLLVGERRKANREIHRFHRSKYTSNWSVAQ